jgi:hypothetical protein
MSHLDDILTDIEARFDDATVDFASGKIELARHKQQRSIVMVRRDGLLKFSSAPNRMPHVAGAVERQVFFREELVEVTMRAESETALDAMLDRFAAAAFAVMGPNAMSDENPYEWHAGDSKQGGANASRQPALTFLMRVRLRSHTPTLPYIELQRLESTVTELDSTVTLTPAVAS